MLPTFKQIHPPKSLPVTAAIEKWKETTLPTFQQPLLLETLYLKKKEKIDSLHLESESAIPLCACVDAESKGRSFGRPR